MVYNKSGGERSSIGNIDARVDNNVIRVGVVRLRKAARLLLVGDEYDWKKFGSRHHTSQRGKACLPHWHRHVELQEVCWLL